MEIQGFKRGYPALYHTRLTLRAQERTISCSGMRGEAQKIYPILSHCRLQLSGCLGEALDEGLRRWQYSLFVPVMLLGRQNAGCGSLQLQLELRTPYSEEIMRYMGTLSCDVDLQPREAIPLGGEEYRLSFDASVCLYLSA
ncbi:MAG: hypothetical protein LBU47_01435 [Christensenellaceae bacterium]|jgi:hypothetical protein|nr:hypothetical protein [Christensenellaceae bacterium]